MIPHTLSVTTHDTTRAVLVHIPHLPYSIVARVFRTGSRQDPRVLHGLTHVVEHLFGQSRTDEYAWQDQCSLLQRHGIVYEAHTTRDYTALCAIQPRESLDVARIFLENLPNVCDAEHLRIELLAIQEELADDAMDIDKTMANTVTRALWPDTSLEHPIAGSISTIEHIDEEAVNNHIQKFFTPSHSDMLIVGDLSDMHPSTMDRQSSAQARETNTSETFNCPRPLTIDGTLSLGERVRVGIYCRTVPASALRERMCLGLFADHIAGFWSSLLNQALRTERGVSYWVNSELAYYCDTGSIGFEFTCNQSQVVSALEQAFHILDTAVTSPLSSERLEALKTARIAEIVRESVNAHMLKGWYIDELVYGDATVTLDGYVRDLMDLESTHVTQTIRQHITPSQRAVVLMGDVDNTIANHVARITGTS